jgi:hypothetical protein
MLVPVLTLALALALVLALAAVLHHPPRLFSLLIRHGGANEQLQLRLALLPEYRLLIHINAYTQTFTHMNWNG